VLRKLWADQPNDMFAKVTIGLLEYRQLAEDLGPHHPSSDPNRAATDRRLTEQVIDQLRPVLESEEPDPCPRIGCRSRAVPNGAGRQPTDLVQPGQRQRRPVGPDSLHQSSAQTVERHRANMLHK
jgi:hypothetical protein